MFGQANLHRNADCAAVLANHIYGQMKEMKVKSPGNYHDVNQTRTPNPRRKGLPATVTEWRAWKAEKRRRASEDQDGLGLTSTPETEEESEELSAFEIARSGKSPPAPITNKTLVYQGEKLPSKSKHRRSARVAQKKGNEAANLPLSTEPDPGASEFLDQFRGYRGRVDEQKAQVPIFTLNPQSQPSPPTPTPSTSLGAGSSGTGSSERGGGGAPNPRGSPHKHLSMLFKNRRYMVKSLSISRMSN